MPHEKTDYVSVLAAAEAVEALGLRIDDERRVAVVVERAPGPVVLSAGGKVNVALDEVFDSDGALEPLDFLVPGGARLRSPCKAPSF